MLLTKLRIVTVVLLVGIWGSAFGSVPIMHPVVRGQQSGVGKRPAEGKKDPEVSQPGVNVVTPKSDCSSPKKTFESFCKALRAEDVNALRACSIQPSGKLVDYREAVLMDLVAEQHFRKAVIARFGREAQEWLSGFEPQSLLDNGKMEVNIKNDRAEMTIQPKATGEKKIVAITTNNHAEAIIKVEGTFMAFFQKEGRDWKMDLSDSVDFQHLDIQEIKRVTKALREDAKTLRLLAAEIESGKIKTLSEATGERDRRLLPIIIGVPYPNPKGQALDNINTGNTEKK